MEKKDLRSGSVLLLTGVAFMAASIALPWKDTGYHWYGAPGLVPGILSLLLALCGLRLILRSRKDREFYEKLSTMEDGCVFEDEDEKDTKAAPSLPDWLSREGPRAVMVGVLCVLYILLLGRIPYMVATGGFIALFIILFRGAGILRSLCIGALSSVSIWFVFYKIFAVFLP